MSSSGGGHRRKRSDAGGATLTVTTRISSRDREEDYSGAESGEERERTDAPSRHERKKYREKMDKKRAKKEKKKKKKKKQQRKDKEESSGPENSSDEEEKVQSDDSEEAERKRKKKKKHHHKRPAEEEYNSEEDSEGSLRGFIVGDDYDQSADEQQQEDLYGYYSEGSWAESESSEDIRENPAYDLQLHRQEFVANRTRRLRSQGQFINLLDQRDMDPLDVSMLEVEVSISSRQAERRSESAQRGAETRARNQEARRQADSAIVITPAPAAAAPVASYTVPDPWNVKDKKGKPTEEPEATEDDKKNGKPICIICQDRVANCLFVPCGQRNICVTCSQRYRDRTDGRDKCPTCRKQWTQIIKVYE